MTWFSWPGFQHRNWFVWVVDLLCYTTGWAESCIGAAVPSLGHLCFGNREIFPAYPKYQTGKLQWTSMCSCGSRCDILQEHTAENWSVGNTVQNPERIFLILSGTQVWSLGSSQSRVVPLGFSSGPGPCRKCRRRSKCVQAQDVSSCLRSEHSLIAETVLHPGGQSHPSGLELDSAP